MCWSEKNTTHHNKCRTTSYLSERILDSDLIIDNNCSYVEPLDQEYCNNDPGDLTVLQLNIRGLIGKQIDLSKILQKGVQNKVDVALLCET